MSILHTISAHEFYMQRCFDLARRGAGTVSPNPLVGSVVVYEDRIIGEGYHMRYGEAHAERNAINAVSNNDRPLLPKSRLYVTLEPCCHHGKTPPCTDLILASGIREVYLSVQDPNPVVSGKGITLLREHGVHVVQGILQEEGLALIRFFRTSMTHHRPHVILKFAQSADGFIGRLDQQVWLSNEYERLMVHKLRSEVDAILIGTNTAVLDNPELTTRYYPGKSPIRVILDRTGRIPPTHHIFDGSTPTIVFTEYKDSFSNMPNVDIIECPFDDDLPANILKELYALRIQSLLIEGGAQLITTFRQKQLWDEACVVKTSKILEHGIKAPLIEGSLKWQYRMAGDEAFAIERQVSSFKFQAENKKDFLSS